MLNSGVMSAVKIVKVGGCEVVEAIAPEEVVAEAIRKRIEGLFGGVKGMALSIVVGDVRSFLNDKISGLIAKANSSGVIDDADLARVFQDVWYLKNKIKRSDGIEVSRFALDLYSELERMAKTWRFSKDRACSELFEHFCERLKMRMEQNGLNEEDIPAVFDKVWPWLKKEVGLKCDGDE